MIEAQSCSFISVSDGGALTFNKNIRNELLLAELSYPGREIRSSAGGRGTTPGPRPAPPGAPGRTCRSASRPPLARRPPRSPRSPARTAWLGCRQGGPGQRPVWRSAPAPGGPPPRPLCTLSLLRFIYYHFIIFNKTGFATHHLSDYHSDYLFDVEMSQAGDVGPCSS